MLKLGRIKFAQKLAFQLLVLTIPTQLGRHFWLSSSYVFGIRVDYFAPTLYLTDIVVVLLLCFFVLEKILTKENLLYKITAVSTFALFLFALVNTWFAGDKVLAFIKWLKVFELYFLVIYISNQKKFDVKNWFVVPFIISGTLFSSIGIVQALAQKSLGGPLYLLGERLFNVSTPGIALGTFLGHYVLRSYSTFSHPNSFAGYLGVFLIAAFFYKSQSKSMQQLRIVPLVSGAIALLLTHSRGVIVFLLMIILAGLTTKTKIFAIKKLTPWFIATVVTASLVMPVLSEKLLEKRGSFFESFQERLFLAKRVGEILPERPMLGVGLNNFILNLVKQGSPEFVWRLQPVHNIFLLVLSEAGLVGLVGLAILFHQSLSRAGIAFKLETNRYIFWSLIFIILTGFIDHYWVTLQQNQLLLALILGQALNKS